MIDIIGLDDYYVGQDDDGNPIWGVTFNHDDTMDGSLNYVDCDDCLVGIGDEETNCWVCGKRVLMQSRAAEKAERKARDKEIYDAAVEALYGEMFPTLQGASNLIFASSSTGMRGVTPSMVVFDEDISWPTYSNWTPSDDLVAYTAWDAIATAQMYADSQILWGDGSDIETVFPDPTSYFDPSRSRWNNIEIDLKALEPEVPSVPRVNLQETCPDLYRPGYERYFENPTERHPRHARHLPRHQPARR